MLIECVGCNLSMFMELFKVINFLIKIFCCFKVLKIVLFFDLRFKILV